MAVDIKNHPCFSFEARHQFSRIHLPVAPRCNVQCNFCNRQFDCVNESRPGVTSGILNPPQALEYLKVAVEKLGNVAVVGIAGPGDPFANPEETLTTLRLVRDRYPGMILCLASNGLNILPYMDELAELQVSHVTLTINAVDPEISSKVYAWMRYGKRVHMGLESAQYLLDQQLTAVKGLTARGILVKVNCILMQGINDHHVSEVARKVSELGAKIFNVMPLKPTDDTPFKVLGEPAPETVRKIRALSALYLPQMAHCSRCRADAAGIIGQDNSPELMAAIQKFEKWTPPKAKAPAASQGSSPVSTDAAPASRGNGSTASADAAPRPYLAVASLEGALVNLHLGQAPEFLVYQRSGEDWSFYQARKAPPSGLGDERWKAIADLLADCKAVFVSGAGARPQEVLGAAGLEVYTVEGVISEVFETYTQGRDMGVLLKRESNACSAGCRGGGGC